MHVTHRGLFARPPLTGDCCAPCQQYRVTSLQHFLPDNSMTSTKQSDGELAFVFGQLTTYLRKATCLKKDRFDSHLPATI